MDHGCLSRAWLGDAVDINHSEGFAVYVIASSLVGSAVLLNFGQLVVRHIDGFGLDATPHFRPVGSFWASRTSRTCEMRSVGLFRMPIARCVAALCRYSRASFELKGTIIEHGA